MNPNQHILTLVSETLNTIDTDQLSLSALLRRASRIARLRNDYLNLWWLEYEMIDITDQEQRKQILKDIIQHFTSEEFKYYFKHFGQTWVRERAYPTINANQEIDDDKLLAKGVAEIEIDIEDHKGMLASINVPQGLHQLDLYYANKEANQIKIIRSVAIRSCSAILERIKQRVHKFLSETEKQLIFGQLQSDIFERNRQYVDTKLGKISPDALSKFVAAYRRMEENSPESRAQALTSCRRLLKSLADVLYPAKEEPITGADGKARILTDEKYITRIWQYIYENTSRSTSGELLLAQVQDLGNRVDRLYELTNKGVHAEVSEFEVNQCVIQMYLLIGDLLRLSENQSAIGMEMNDIM